MYAYFERFTLSMTLKEANSISHPGNCEDDVKAFLCSGKMDRQFRKISADLIRDELKEYGAWDDEELSDTTLNKERITWIAAGNIVETRKDRPFRLK